MTDFFTCNKLAALFYWGCLFLSQWTANATDRTAFRLPTDGWTECRNALEITMIKPLSNVSSETVTVTDALSSRYLQHLEDQQRAKDTIQAYGRYVTAWRNYWEKNPDGTDCPVIKNIRQNDLLAFRRYLVHVRGFSNRNANKYVNAIEAILAYCGTQAEPFYIDRPPKIHRLPEKKAAAKFYFRFLRANEIIQLASRDTDDQAKAKDRCQLSKLYQACDSVNWPLRSRAGQRLNPVRQWRAAIVMYATYGFRTEELISYSSDSRSMLNRQVFFQEEMPTGLHCENEHGWFMYVPTKQQATKPDPLVLPLNACANWHLKSVLGDNPDPVRPVFDWPLNSDRFYANWRRILNASKIKLPVGPEGDTVPLNLKHLRKTCATWFDYHANCGQLITGHAPRDTVNQNYINSEGVILDAVNSIPIPYAWREGMTE